jgi:hypothetical protein
MHVFLWVVQAVLAAMFGMSGWGKLSWSQAKLAKQYPWTTQFELGTVRFIGVMDLLGAAGLIAPAASGIATLLTPLAATGFAVLMLLAMATHLRLHEQKALYVNVPLFALAVLVAWGRFGPYSW